LTWIRFSGAQPTEVRALHVRQISVPSHLHISCKLPEDWLVIEISGGNTTVTTASGLSPDCVPG
jgi:hypothetical protein